MSDGMQARLGRLRAMPYLLLLVADVSFGGNWVADRVVDFYSSRRRHTILQGDWSSDVCSSDLRFARRRVSGGLGVSGICDRRADGFRFLLKHRRKLFAKDPNDHAGDNGKVDPLEDFRGAFGGRVASFFRSVRANYGEEQHK